MEDTPRTVWFDDPVEQQGYTVFPNAVLLDSRLSLQARMLYATLAYYARQDGSCFPGQARLERDVGMSIRTIRDSTRELESAGLVETKRRNGGGNVYILHRPPAGDAGDHRQEMPHPRHELPVEEDTPTKTQTDEETTGDDGSSLALPTSSLPGLESNEDTATVAIWNHYLTIFGDRVRIRQLTPPRERVLRKALKAVGGDVELCKRAIDGLKSYRETHPDGSKEVNVSVVFETTMHTRASLTDQIEWWASQANDDTSSIDSRVPQVLHAKVHRKRLEAAEMLRGGTDEGVRERGEAAQAWLQDEAYEKAVFDSDGRIVFRRV